MAAAGPPANTAAAAAAAPAPAPAPSPFRRLIHLDESLSLRIHDAFLVVPRPLLKALEISGDGFFWFPVPAALLLASPSPRLTSVLLVLLAGFLLDLLLVGLVKYLVRRPRPVYNKGMFLTFGADHWSFPSGHSSRVFFIATFFHLLSGAIGEDVVGDGSDLWRRWAGFVDSYGFEAGEVFLTVVFLWSAATSVSRVLLGRHFVVDVIAGACLGVLEGLFVFIIFNSWMP